MELPEFDPRRPFFVGSVRYWLDLDADMPTLHRLEPRAFDIGGTGTYLQPVATFGPSWSPIEVLRAAVEDLALQVRSQGEKVQAGPGGV